MGRWMYLESRGRVHPLVMAPILVLTILLAPIGFLVFVAVRQSARERPRIDVGSRP